MPGTTWPDPSPLEHVTAQAQPSASSTEMCVVEPSRLARNVLGKSGSGKPGHELRGALVLRPAHDVSEPGGGRRAGLRSSSASA